MGLIHWWPLNGDKHDHAGNLELTSSSSTFVEGKIHKALQLNNVIAKVANPFIGLKNWSISFWLMDNGSSAWSDFICFSHNLIRLELDNASNWRWYLGDAGTGSTYPATGNLFGSGTILNNGASASTWYHVVIVKKDTTAQFYLNGVLKNTTTSATSFTSASATMYFNSRAKETTSSKMSLSDVRCYDHALSLTEIAELKRGLVVHYNFEAQQLSTEYDCSGHEYNATINGVTLSSDTAIGVHSGYFSNGQQWLEHSGAPYNSSEIGVSMWIKSNNTSPKNGYHIPLSIDAGRVEFSIPSNGQLRWGGYINSTRYCGNVTCTNSSGSTFSLLNNKWHHVVVTFDGAGWKGYVDGVHQGTHNCSGSISYTDKTLRIGKYTAGATSNYGATDMYIADVRVYNTALTQADVTSLYNHTVKVTPDQAMIGNYLVETSSQIDFYDVNVWKDAGHGSRKQLVEDGIELTALNGWESFAITTPSDMIGKKIVFSFDYKWTSETRGNSGECSVWSENKVYYWINSGALMVSDISTLPTGQWAHVTAVIDSASTYTGFMNRGKDETGKVYGLICRNFSLQLATESEVKIHPTGVVTTSRYGDSNKVRIIKAGNLTAETFVEI